DFSFREIAALSAREEAVSAASCRWPAGCFVIGLSDGSRSLGASWCVMGPGGRALGGGSRGLDGARVAESPGTVPVVNRRRRTRPPTEMKKGNRDALSPMQSRAARERAVRELWAPLHPLPRASTSPPQVGARPRVPGQPPDAGGGGLPGVDVR